MDWYLQKTVPKSSAACKILQSLAFDLIAIFNVIISISPIVSDERFRCHMQTPGQYLANFVSNHEYMRISEYQEI